MSNSSELIHQYGFLFVFGNVLVEQLGLPIPAIPVLLLAGTAAAKGEISLTSAFAWAVVASLIADSLWYEIGRKKGGIVLSVACRISLNPDSCVRQTESFLAQWGFPSLLVAKFIPGFSMVAPPTVGSMKKPRYLFWLFDTIGAGLWAGTALTAGFIFFNSIEKILNGLTRLGQLAIVLIVLVFVSFALVKYLQRRRFYQSLQIPRISIEDLKKLIDEGQNPLVLDVRSEVAQSIDTDRIPGAQGVLLENLRANHFDLPRDREIITYCTCPNEASAALAAQILMNRAFQGVYPLKGGLEAWRKAGYPVESVRTETKPIPTGEVPIAVVSISGEKPKTALPPCD
jgi:membrane protein DedA with SNARE-associated domain/rhodanese-related sulfurtransferase